MAATTEQLSGQADQLLHALGFFQTQDTGAAPVARSAAVKAPATASNPAVAHGGHAARSARAKPAATSGFALKMKEKGGATDKEFERY
jgi:hypothetical protein